MDLRLSLQRKIAEYGIEHQDKYLAKDGLQRCSPNPLTVSGLTQD